MLKTKADAEVTRTVASQKSRKIPPNPLAPKGPSAKAGIDSFQPVPPSSKSSVLLVFHIAICEALINQTCRHSCPFSTEVVPAPSAGAETSSQPQNLDWSGSLNINDDDFNN